jgi:YHS domain-containing protein
MPVVLAEAKAAGHTSEYGGRTIPFCSEDCKKSFDENPAKYAGKGATAAGHGQMP